MTGFLNLMHDITDGIPEELSEKDQEALNEVLQEAERKKTNARILAEEVLDNKNAVVEQQLEAEELILDVTGGSNVSELSSDLAVAVLDMDKKTHSENKLMLFLQGAISSKISDYTNKTFANIFADGCPFNDRSNLIYHIADCIRHGTKKDPFRFYQGAVSEKDVGTTLKSAAINTGLFFLGNQKSRFLSPRDLTDDVEKQKFTALTHEALEWTVDHRFSCGFYVIPRDIVPDDSELIRANLPAVIVDSNKKPIKFIVVNETGSIISFNSLPTGSLAKELAAHIDENYFESPNLKAVTLEAGSSILQWLIKRGHTPSKKFSSSMSSS